MMPVIHRNMICVKAEGGKAVDFCMVTKYKARAKSFSIELPEWWATVVGYKTVYGATEDKVNHAFWEAGEKFEELTTTKRKVIIYTFNSSAILSVLKNGGYGGGYHSFNHPDFDHVVFRSMGPGQEHSMSAKGTAIDVFFEVAYECTSRFQEYATYLSDDRKIGDSRDKDLRVMEWTPEREAFFMAFELELSKMAYKLNTFLNDDAEKMAALIDKHRNAFALPFPKTSKKTTENKKE